ncbi:LysR family transcriptional regulator [Chelativorans sp. M5D2P16]|uniref:LysR family transcriptional regulator n=1 Tax=Chelativorans sp. M5D2P16 TaxID=3095678 RepID=UPI002ACA6036|nr:LysR family transcriptional regulator [Chelativorans sp. M5D2P16]MDZ5695658.1 LysR family transcriptional regulator [Chelativorans sp. M5D2P16]
MQWNDLHLVLAIAASGSLSGAARRLGVSHATVFRQLGGLEERLGVRLFDRSRNGYTPTLAGEELATVARRIEREVLAAERRIAGRDLRPSGTVRLTTTDTLLFGVLSPILADFREAYPEIELEVAASNEVFSLTRREADVALRPATAPPEILVGRRIATIAQAVYGNREFIPDAADIHAHAWVGPDERMQYPALEKWLREAGLLAHSRYRTNTMLGLYLAAKEGAGLAVLPCYLGDGDKELRRVGAPIEALATDLWLLTHADLRATARIRVFLDFLADALKRQRGRLAGEGWPSRHESGDKVPAR